MSTRDACGRWVVRAVVVTIVIGGALLLLPRRAVAADAGADAGTGAPPPPPPRTYEIEGLALRYDPPHPTLPPIDELMNVSVRLAADGSTFFSPGERAAAGRAAQPVRVRDLSGRPVRLTAEALAAIYTAIVRHLNDRGFIGVFAAPDPQDIDPDSGDDLRPADRKALRLVVSVPTVGRVRTLASGERVPADQPRIDNPLHERVRRNSPLAPATQNSAAGGSLLRRDLLDDYVLRLNRYPGRHVDVALSADDKPNSAVLDYLISESRPLSVYTGVSNTGTKATNEWRERVGVIWNQVSGRDDTLSADFVTSSFDTSNALTLSYDAPVFSSERLRWRAYGVYDNFDASEFGVQGIGRSEFDGYQIGGGAELIANVFQHRELFLDAIAGARYDTYQVHNHVLGSRAGASFASPYVGLRLERITEAASTLGELTFSYSQTDAHGTTVQQLGRFPVNRDWFTLRGSLSQSLFLEPIVPWLRGPRYQNLAHEIAVSARGQYVLDNHRLIPEEEGVIGGFYSVRGYPESLTDGDDVAVVSAEYRYHLPRGLGIQPQPGNLLGRPFRYRPQQAFGRPDWDLVPKAFIDAGWAHNNDVQRTQERNATLVGAGVGIEFQFKQYLNVRLDYGFALTSFRPVTGSEHTNSGDGRLHFSVTLQY